MSASGTRPDQKSGFTDRPLLSLTGPIADLTRSTVAAVLPNSHSRLHAAEPARMCTEDRVPESVYLDHDGAQAYRLRK